MRIWLLPLLACALDAAVIRGTVVENLTGHAISRASVQLDPVPGSPGTRKTVRSDRFGFFEISGEPAGTYLLEVSRIPYLTAQYGQKRWNFAGMPLVVTESDTPFVTIRMVRFGSIAGTVRDENDVGQAEFLVAAYRNTRPLQLIASATADDRGDYRIPGLLPGSYLVRTAAKQVDEMGYKPTFGKETEVPDQGRLVDVEIERQADDMDIRPLTGKLLSLAVEAIVPIHDPPYPVTLTFASEMGRQVVESALHTFTGLVSGYYEVFAVAPTEDPDVKLSAYQRVSVTRDSGVQMTLNPDREVQFQFDGISPQSARDGSLKLLGRRKDLAGWHDQQTLKLANGRIKLAVGPWEFAVIPPEGYYVSGFSGPDRYRPNSRSDGWNETVITYGGTVRFSLSGNASSLHGTVNDAGNPVIGAPVYLEPVDLPRDRRMAPVYVAISGMQGQYRFTGLTPGTYRLLSTFEYQMPDSDNMVSAGAKELRIDAQADPGQDLDLYVIR